MKVLLTGATGSIGGSALQGLVSGGFEVVCLVRDISKAQSLLSHYGGQLSFVQLNPNEDHYTTFRELSKGYDKIVHTGYANHAGEKDLELSVLNGLLDSAKETAEQKPVTFVHTTGCLIVGETFELVGEDVTSTENSIELTKWRVESETIALAANSENLHVSVVRPGWLYGCSTVDLWFRSVKKHGKIVVPEKNGRPSFIHREDLASIYRLVVENSATGVFIASEGAGPNVDEIVEIAKQITGVQEVEKVANVWEHIQSYGFFLVGLSLTQLLDSKRARELYGFVPKHDITKEARELLALE